jgi:PAS domain S-box-containing protein
VIGKSFSKIKGLFSKEDMKRHIQTIKNAANGVKLNDYEGDLLSKDETRYRFLFSIDIIEEKEKVKGILLRGRDITKRQRAWEELVKLEENYRVLAETSADGVLTIDPLGRLTYVNPSFEKMCGRRKNQILATLFRDYLSEDSIYLFQQISLDIRKKGEKIENVELELVNSNGYSIPIEVNIAPLKKDNEFAGVECTVRDITERKKIEEELKKSERLKTEFMNIAAHELKSPVTPIKGYLDLIIQDKDASKKVKNWARISLRNSMRLMKLVNDILDVSRLDSDTMRFDMEKLDLSEILTEVSEDMKPVIDEKKLEFKNYIRKNLPSILGDRNRLLQVLKNLLVNAIKFTDNGSIILKAKKEDKYILISVEDTGIGISADELKKIFTKFYQAYTGDDRKNEGTGLGLFICKEIIGKHNGEIWAESELGKGSKFIIKLPHL